MTHLTSDALLHEPFTWLYGSGAPGWTMPTCATCAGSGPREKTTLTRHASKSFNLYLGFPEIDAA